MAKIKINWAFWGSVLSALAGVVGTVVTPVYATGLVTALQTALQTVSGILMAIGAFHVTTVAAATAKAKAFARIQAPPA